MPHHKTKPNHPHAPARGAREAGLGPVGELLVAHAGDHHHGLLQHGVLFLVIMLAVVGS